MSDLDCPKQARCPGCPYGDEPYAQGLASKQARVAQALASYVELAPLLEPSRAADPIVGYRLRAKLVSQRSALGLYARGSHRVVDVAGCRVLAPSVARASEALRRLLPLPIHGADLRETSEGILLTLLTEQPGAQARLEAVARQLVEDGSVRSVAIALREPGEVRLLAGEPQLLAGPRLAQHRLSADAPYAYAAHGGFVQAHAGQASYVQGAVVGHLQSALGGLSGKAVLELFAGNGSLALTLARAGARVTAVEAYAPAIALAERAALEQGLALRACAADAAAFVEAAARSGERYDAVIVNPPRRGLSAALRRALAGLSPRALAYLSCNPLTLARDLWQLQGSGLSPLRVEPLDMIPWSEAVEALCWLAPAPRPLPRVLFEDERWLAVDKPPHELVAAAQSVEPGRTLLARVRGLPSCGEARTVESWGPGVSGVCWFAKHEDDAAPLRSALARAERELTVLARGNLRKQGTITRRAGESATRGARYQKLRDAGRHSLMHVRASDADETGTLRDFASIGHPVLGDARYGDARSNQHVEHRFGLDRPFVHCQAIALTMPDGRALRVSSELAPDLAGVLASLGSDEAAV
ncbi:MAG TPA: methyltransferase [Polyangiaceae bacterium]